MFLSRFGRTSVVAVATVAIAVGARRSIQRPAPDWRARFTRAALQIPFGPDQVPAVDSGLPRDTFPANAPRMKIALALTRDTGRVSGIESRITSEGAYPKLGIAPGVNYVWREFVNDTLRNLVIPANTKYRPHWLVFVPHTHVSPRSEPRLIVYDSVRLANMRRGGGPPQQQTMKLAVGKCTRDCPSPEPWCVAGDTTKSRIWISKLPTTVDIAKYFARNNVVYER